MTVILDGGMGSELIRRGAGDARGLWSARALLEAPESVVGVHRDYMAVGAEIIITNTYSTIPSYLLELTELAGSLARSAVEGAPGEARVAGSLPPLSESYRPDLVHPMPRRAPRMGKWSKRLTPMWTSSSARPCPRPVKLATPPAWPGVTRPSRSTCPGR